MSSGPGWSFWTEKILPKIPYPKRVYDNLKHFLKAEYSISYADCFAFASATEYKAIPGGCLKTSNLPCRSFIEKLKFQNEEFNV